MKTAIFLTDKEMDILFVSLKEYEEKYYSSTDEIWQEEINNLLNKLESKGTDEINPIEVNKMKTLKEEINNLPHTKIWLFIEYYFKAYEKTQNKKQKPYTVAKYREKEYIQLLKRSLTREELEKELVKMLPRTTWAVNTIMLEVGAELKQLGDYFNKEVE